MFRKHWLSLLLLPVLAMLTQAEAPAATAFQPGDFTMADFAIVRITDKALIKLGMSRQEAEKLLGPSQGRANLYKADTYGGLMLYYRESKVVCISAAFSDGEALPYATSRGIGAGNSRREIEAVYGLGASERNWPDLLTYRVEQTDAGLAWRGFEEPLYFPNGTKVYLLQFVFEELEEQTEKLASIWLMDWQYATTFR